jgi:hypothetical protein
VLRVSVTLLTVKLVVALPACQVGGDLLLAQRGAQGMELSDSVAHEIGEPVDGRTRLNERPRPGLFQALHPRPDGGRGDEKGIGGLLEGPTACGAQLENLQAYGGWVIGTVLGRHVGHAGVFDPNLGSEESDF